MKNLNISELLEKHGYVALTMERNQLGQFELAAKAEGQMLRLLVDTGASSTVLDTSQAQALGVDARKISDRGAGLGTDQAEVLSACVNLELAQLVLADFKVYFMDFGTTQSAIEKLGGRKVEGVVGADILGPGEAVIDYGKAVLYLKPEGLKA